MNIKPFRDYDEHDVVNLYALDAATATKGTFVELVSFNPSSYAGWTDVNVGASYAGTWSKRFGVNARVKPTASGSNKVLGMLLYDVSDTDENGQQIRFLPREDKIARCIVSSGEPVPVLTKGVVEINGYQGVAGAGSGAAVSTSGDGSIVVVAPNVTANRIGKFLSSSGKDGYALLKIEL